MNILQVYEAQRARAKEQFSDIVSEAEILHVASGEPLKLRLEIVDGSIVDIYLSVTGKYSYHWERRLINGTLYRHDNAPHKSWENVHTFPKHFHEGSQETVRESRISEEPLLALEQFLEFVRAKLAERAGHDDTQSQHHLDA
jgi:hypothetical protein